MFTWQLVPLTGHGTLTTQPDLRSAVLSHKVQKRFGGTTYAPGTVRVEAASRYNNAWLRAAQVTSLL